ncbi:hypothetical protein K7432_010632 [Basidiobolus ranarum]|uniref:Uncharacterized protein n=1 Tax=Basidiobolus ranarum TaxID=34480 RepID=A0ABR2VV40_9FUNG
MHKELWFISPHAAKSLAVRHGASDITRIAVQTLNIFLERLIVVYIKEAYDHEGYSERFTLTTKNLFPNQGLASQIIEQAWEFTSLFQFKNHSKVEEWSEYTKEHVTKQVRLQCSWYSTLGSGVHVKNTDDKIFLDFQSAAYLSGTLEVIGRLILSQAAILVIPRSDSTVSERTIEEILRTDASLRRSFVKTDLYNSLEEKRLERYGGTPERNIVTTYSLNAKSSVYGSQSDSEDDESILTIRTSIDSGCTKERMNLFVRFLHGFKTKKRRPEVRARNFETRPQNLESNEKYLAPKPFSIASSQRYSRWGSSLSDLSLSSSPPNVNYQVDPTKARRFEELLESEETVKITLTSTRLRSIEVDRHQRMIPRDAKYTTVGEESRPMNRKKSFWS